jgi:hypothetical protein
MLCAQHPQVTQVGGQLLSCVVSRSNPAQGSPIARTGIPDALSVSSATQTDNANRRTVSV